MSTRQELDALAQVSKNAVASHVLSPRFQQRLPVRVVGRNHEIVTSVTDEIGDMDANLLSRRLSHLREAMARARPRSPTGARVFAMEQSYPVIDRFDMNRFDFLLMGSGSL